MKQLLILYTILLNAFVLNAQDVKDEFKKINETFAKTPALAMDIRYELFLDGAAKPEETESGRYIREGKKYYSMQANNEVVITGEFMYIIDREQKVLGVDRKIDEKKIMNPLEANLDSLYLLYSKIETILPRTAGEKAYRFYIKEGPYSICEVYFDGSTHFVTEIKNVFRQKISDGNDKLRSAVLTTTFFNITTHPDNMLQVFDDKKYIKKINNKYVPSEGYKAYRFINHLN